MQTILQGARLNFLKIPNAVVNLIQTIQRKSEHLEEPKGTYFGKLQKFFVGTVQSAGAHFNSGSHTLKSDVKSFKEKTIRPFLSIPIDKIEEVFIISEPIERFHINVPCNFSKGS